MRTSLDWSRRQQRRDKPSNALPARERRRPSPRRDWAGSTFIKMVETIGRSEAKSSVLASHLLDCAPLMRPKRRAPRGTLELFAQLVATQTRVSEDAVQRPALEFAMQRHNKRDGPILVLETNVAAALAGYFPAELLKHID